MLVAEKQLLDANLRNELQVLRRLELKMLVNRYANAIPTATMIGGFTFTGVVELDLLDPQYVDHDDYTKLVAGLFHVFAALALSTAVYALSVSSIAIVLGQRLAIQATATQTVRHEKNVRELANKFTTVLFALGVSLASVVGATICAIWARYSGEVVSAVVATCVFAAILPIVIWGVYTLNARLNDTVDETSTVNLTYEKGHLDVSEFRVGDSMSIPSKSDIEAAMGKSAHKSTTRHDERSALLQCIPPPKKPP